MTPTLGMEPFENRTWTIHKKRAAALQWTWVDIVVEMLPVVEPHLGEAGVVMVDHAARAAGERVRRGLAEHVAHVRARRYLERAAAHPHLPRPQCHVTRNAAGSRRPRVACYAI